ncbi:MAG: methionyl-tRNA formyltransferase [Candidatus Latescibacteria bacterium]|nr:methionyl-tRNA formyltransferase [Candidatus Latescibacterota bacterium]
MGTPAFAVPSLERLAASGHEIVAVVTNPDRPQGRGRKVAPPPVKSAALDLGLQVLQPQSVAEPELAAALAGLQVDLFVVVAFSILPPSLLAVPRWGSVNLHPSLLPAYRGAAPIIWAVINGESETGITTFQLNKRVDAGGILLQRRIAIGADETAGELDARLRLLGADLLVETVDQLEAGTLEPRPQDRRGVTRAPKLTREDGRLDWGQPALALRNRIRGTQPVPGAFTPWAQGDLKIHQAQLWDGATNGPAGTVLQVDALAGVVVAAGQGALLLTQVQPAGKARMSGGDFVRGYPLAVGDRLGTAQ